MYRFIERQHAYVCQQDVLLIEIDQTLTPISVLVGCARFELIMLRQYIFI